ncbi:MAG: acyltransferase, partial [Pseudonocardia sp.]|nr:acyltransferase [Pseudonocardia sp.]
MTRCDAVRAAPRRYPPRPPRFGLIHLPGLDGLRAVAVLAVLAYHSDATWAAGGFLGVEMFFVLSGYLVTGLLVAQLARRGRVDLGAFYRARARRLFPALVACVAGVVAAHKLLMPDPARPPHGDALTALAYVHNWSLILREVPYAEGFERPSLLLHLWSLSIEGQLYLLWPLLLVTAFGMVARRLLVVGVVVLAAASTLGMALLYDPDDAGRVYFGTDTRASGFLLGAALAIGCLPWLRTRTRPTLRKVLDVAALGALGGLGVVLVAASEFDDALYRHGGFAATGLLTAVVVAAVAYPGSRVGRGLGRRPLVWLGQRSYGIYLYHWPVFVLTRPGIDVPDVPPLVELGRVAATLVLAEASYRWLELPVRHGVLGRWWSSPRRPAAVLCGTSLALATLTLICVPTVLPAPPVTLGA